MQNLIIVFGHFFSREIMIFCDVSIMINGHLLLQCISLYPKKRNIYFALFFKGVDIILNLPSRGHIKCCSDCGASLPSTPAVKTVA